MTPSTQLVKQAASLLDTASRPAILVGPQAAGSIALVVELADLLGAAIATTPDALSLIDGRRSCGVYSFGASAHCRGVMDRADLILAMSDLSEFTCRLGEAFAGRTLIQVTDSVDGVSRKHEPSIVLFGDLHSTLIELRALLGQGKRPRKPWFPGLPPRTHGSSLAPRSALIHPEAAALAIEAALPDSVRVCLDVTSAALYCYQQWRLAPGQRAFSSIEQSACMGEAVLASLGVRLASGLPTLAVVGDWGQLMVPSEIHTAVELGMDRYVVVVWANGGGAFIGAGVSQQGLHVPEATWRWREPPSFARVAEGLGARGVVATNAATLQRAVSDGLRGKGPVVIEARIDPAAPIPAGDRFLSLGESRV
jgi:thiamine pyrophosphate-dependent acetolactate synthase large subunit-like protein